MEKSYKRAVRRAHYQRLKKKRSTHWGYPHDRFYCMISEGDSGIEVMPDETRGCVANTPTPCSCLGCGNPRRKVGAKTRKEIAHYHDFVDQMGDLGIHSKYAKNQAGFSWW